MIATTELPTKETRRFSSALTALSEGARRLARARGHVMGPPVVDDDAWNSPVAYECQLCGDWLLLVLLGDEDQDPVTGRAVRRDCPGRPIG